MKRSLSRGRSTVRSSSRKRLRTKTPSRGGSVQTLKQTPKRSKSRKRSTSSKNGANIAADDLHSGITTQIGKFVAFKKPSHKIDHKSKIDYYYTYQQQLKVATAGVQAAADISMIGTVSQWTASTAVPVTGITSQVRYFDFNPAQKITGSAFITGSVPGNDKLCLYSSESIFDFANFSNAAVYIRLTAYKCLRDTSQSPDAAWGNIVGEEAMGTTGQVIPPLLNVTGTAAGTLSKGMPYTNAYDIPDFRKVWQPIYKTSFELASAASHKVELHGMHNQCMDQVVLQQVATTTFMKGTIAFHMTAVGQPIYDTVATQITYGPIEVGLLQRTKLCFKSYFEGPQRLQGTFGQFGTVASTILANSKILNYAETGAAAVQVF
nr:MAG: capsid protein [Cressdnaviricota sp.]